MSSSSNIPNWMVPVEELTGVEAWTGGSRPMPDSGYYRGSWAELSWGERPGSFSTDIALVSDDLVANGYTSKNFWDLMLPRKTDKQNNPTETPEEHAKRLNTERGKWLGFLVEGCGLPEEWVRAQKWCDAAFIAQVFASIKVGQAIAVGTEGHRELFYVSFAKPGELQKTRADGKPNYGQLTVMSRTDWETSKGTGKPPEYRTRGGQAETATQQAALPGSVTRLAAGGGGGVGGTTLVPPTGALPGAAASFNGIPAAGAAGPAAGSLPPLPQGLGIPR